MRILLLLAAGALVLAGCVTPPDSATTAQLEGLLPDLSTRGVFHTASGAIVPALMVPATGAQFHHGNPASEPTIGVTSDGVVFMTGMAKGGYRGGPTVYRTVDHGQAWEDKGPKLPNGDALPPNTNDPYVYVDPATDRVFMLDLHALVCSTLSWSDDGGDSWTTNPLGCGHPVGAHDHQTMVAAKPRGPVKPIGYENVLYYCVNRVVDTACSTSLNGGLSFGPLTSVFGGTARGHRGGTMGHLEAAPDGTVYIARSSGGMAVLAVTQDDGLTWQQHVISDVRPDYHDVDLAVDEAGTLYAFYQSKYRFLLLHSLDQGKTWSEPIDVTAPGITGGGYFYAVAAGKPGHVAVAYVATTVEDGYEGKPRGIGGLAGSIRGEPDPEEWADANWNAYLGILTDATASDPLIQSVMANPVEDPIARGLCGGTRCRGMTDFIDVQIAPDGRPWASFVDVCNDQCVSDPGVRWDRPIGFAATLLSGPALRGEAATLPAILAPPLQEMSE